MCKEPLVSILILAWNSKEHLPICLARLLAQSFQDFEIFILNNGPQDAELEELQGKYAKLDLIIKNLGSNLGFAAANNIGARLARGQWIALLNADAYPEPHWLENLIAAAEGNPQFNFFSSRQLQADTPELLDGAGDTYHASGLAWRRHYNHPASEYGLHAEEVFGACAAAALYRREDFLAVGGFDETYFAYFEDVDLSFRLRLAGGRCLYVSDAVVHHVGSASTGKTSDFVYFHVHRNLVWTYFKNMPGALFWLFLPSHMAVNLYVSMQVWVKEGRIIVFKAKLDALRALPSVLKKRSQVQKLRKVSLRELYRIMTKDLLAPRRAARVQTQSK